MYAGSQPGRRPEYADAARRLVTELADRGLGLVYGGGKVGMMGALAEAALGHGIEVIGVIPRQLEEREVAHRGLSELRVVGSMHERKALMAELSAAFVALPGGFGTLEELTEMLTWAQLGLHTKRCGLMNVEHYYDPFVAFVERAVEEGFVMPANRMLLRVGTDPAALLDDVLPHFVGRTSIQITPRGTR